MKIRLLLSYKGTDFFGWQKQKKLRTVQGELEKVLQKIFQKKILIQGSGRTDTGVHALEQQAHFDISQKEFKSRDLFTIFNKLLPQDISVLNVLQAPDEFHARFSAQKKTYIYFIYVSPKLAPFLCDFMWNRSSPLTLKTLNELASVFKGTHDFKSFQNSGSPVKTTVKTIYSSRWFKISPEIYGYEVTGNGFLKQMVRNMVGTQIDLFKEKEPQRALQKILKSKDRRQALRVAPSQGLFLKKVFYPSALDRKCIKL